MPNFDVFIACSFTRRSGVRTLEYDNLSIQSPNRSLVTTQGHDIRPGNRTIGRPVQKSKKIVQPHTIMFGQVVVVVALVDQISGTCSIGGAPHST